MKKAIVIIGLLLCGNAVSANKLVLLINPGDCIACQGGLRDTVLLREYFQDITIAFSPRFRRDSVALLERMPFIGNTVFTVKWHDGVIPQSERELVSGAYYIDNSGNIIDKTPLKQFTPQLFFTNNGSKINTVSYKDTIITANSLPTAISDFIVTPRNLFFIDKVRDRIVYVDYVGKNKEYTVLNIDSLTKSAYQLFYGPQQVEKELSRNRTIFKKEGIGREYSIARISAQGSAVNIAVKYYYTNSVFLSNFIMNYGYDENGLKRKLLIFDSNNYFSDGYIYTTLRKYATVDSGALDSVSSNQFLADIDGLDRKHKQAHPELYSPSSCSLFLSSKGGYLIPVRLNEKSFKFIGLYKARGDLLIPENKMLNVEKGKVYKSSNNFKDFSPLCGSYPYVMHHISNVLYNLETDSEYVLPLDLGSYDIGADAMHKMHPKTSLYIYDEIVVDGVVRVLYTKNDQNSLFMLTYNLATKMIITDGVINYRGAEYKINPEEQFRFADKNIFFSADAIDGVLTRCFVN